MKTDSRNWPVRLNMILILAGILLRLAHYLENQPLWLDEAWVAVDILSKTFRDIVVNRTYFPDLAFMPILFQVFCKLAVNTLGNHELSLRLFPFLSSIVSLVLFYQILKKWGQGWVIPLALGLFTLDYYLIYYAAELKPYASDCLAAIILALMFEKLKSDDRRRSIYLFGGIAALGFWLSYPSIFVSGGFLISSLVFACKNGRRERIGKLIFAGALVIIGSLGALIRLPQRMGAHSPMAQMHRDHYMPVENGLVECIKWLWNVNLHVFSNPLGLLNEWMGIILFAFGVWAVFHKDKENAVTLLSPILLTLLAACLGKYLFLERLLLFLVPFYCYFIAEGVLALSQRFSQRQLTVLIVLAVLLFSRPLAESVYYLKTGHQREDSRGIMQFLMRHYHKGDTLFMNNSAQYAFGYYALKDEFYRQFAQESLERGKKVFKWRMIKASDQLSCIDGQEILVYQYERLLYTNVILSAPEEQDYLFAGMGRSHLPAGRIWVILMGGKPVTRAFTKDRFMEFGEPLLSFESFGGAAYLFDLAQQDH